MYQALDSKQHIFLTAWTLPEAKDDYSAMSSIMATVYSVTIPIILSSTHLRRFYERTLISHSLSSLQFYAVACRECIQPTNGKGSV